MKSRISVNPNTKKKNKQKELKFGCVVIIGVEN